MNNEKQQAIALAATVQALSIVNELATTGNFDTESARTVLHALITYDPVNAEQAFGDNLNGLRVGIGQTKKLLSDDLNRDIAQYLLTVIAIELKLVRNQTMRQHLSGELQRISSQIHNSQSHSHDDDEDDIFFINQLLTSDAVMADFANLYKDTASRTEPRIMIKGNQQFLQNETTANQIRGMLLAALRSAAFFRQYGGKRINLMLKRKQYIEALEQL